MKKILIPISYALLVAGIVWLPAPFHAVAWMGLGIAILGTLCGWVEGIYQRTQINGLEEVEMPSVGFSIDELPDFDIRMIDVPAVAEWAEEVESGIITIIEFRRRYENWLTANGYWKPVGGTEYDLDYEKEES